MTSKAAKGRKESAGSKKVERLIDNLSTAGMPKGIARTLAFLTTKEDWSTSKDIEHATRLRQPEVSIAVRSLVDRGWVERDNLKRESKGRPICIYRMAVDLKEVYKAIEATEKEKIADVEANLKSIRQLWSVN
jgi:predicted transcriptional regulator